MFCQDCLVYLLNREQHTVGQETASARPNICLSSPDVLPLHCRIRRAPQRRSSSDQRLLLEPIAHGNVLVNFMRIERPTPLRHGDLLSFGAHYIFLYKDPLSAKPLPAQTLTRLRALARLCDSESGSVPEKGTHVVCVGPYYMNRWRLGAALRLLHEVHRNESLRWNLSGLMRMRWWTVCWHLLNRAEMTTSWHQHICFVFASSTQRIYFHLAASVNYCWKLPRGFRP